ncbi:hypothetical protein [Nonomuraea sp. NPDC050202]|uniref:hypothetical protein n=1 Tax=Nonomuraea sp. NPDC050202 TaxID=3155035 RepID=UPI0033D7DA7C
MSYALTDLTFSEAARAEIAPMVDTCYREALIYLRQAEAMREAAGLPLPPVGAELYARLIPAQAVSR